MAISCEPNDLTALARCFSCLPPNTLLAVQTYLLCQIANTGAGGGGSLTSQTVYASGTAANLSDVSQLLDFGTQDPTLTINTAGTYLLLSRVMYHQASTNAAGVPATFKLRRRNNGAADIANSSTTTENDLQANVGPVIADFEVSLPPVIYTATAGDIIDLFGVIGNAVNPGDQQCTEACIIALKIG